MARSEKYLTWRNCGRKKKFYSTKSANRTIRAIKYNTGRQMYYYKCLSCGGYHLTKVKQKVMAKH